MPQANGMLIGLTAIGAAFGKSRWTIRRWIDQQAFPAARLPSGQWVTSWTLIDRWIIERGKADPLIKTAIQRDDKEQ